MTRLSCQKNLYSVASNIVLSYFFSLTVYTKVHELKRHQLSLAVKQYCSTARLGCSAFRCFDYSACLAVLRLYVAALEEVSKIVVTAMPGGGVGIWLLCCMRSRSARAGLNPSSGHSCIHFNPATKSCPTPSPAKYRVARAHCAGAKPASADIPIFGTT